MSEFSDMFSGSDLNRAVSVAMSLADVLTKFGEGGGITHPGLSVLLAKVRPIDKYQGVVQLLATGSPEETKELCDRVAAIVDDMKKKRQMKGNIN